MPAKTGGKKTTINVNQMIYKEMHRPQVSDGDHRFPIYTKVDGYKGDGKDTLAESNGKYQQRSKYQYNSANNIRKLYIMHDKICIEYYKSPGTPNAKIPSSVQASLSTDLLRVIPSILTYQQDLVAYQMQQMIDSRVTGPDEYVIEGNLFGVLNQMYTCNNIEEIYFDWTYMFTTEIQKFLASYGLGGYVGPNAMDAFLHASEQTTGKFIKDNVWTIWFKNTAFDKGESARLSREPERFRNKYPRLKMIAMVHNLGDIVWSSIRSHSLMNELKTGGEPTWLVKNSELLQQSGSVIIASQLDNVPAINTKFITQESVYLFDKGFAKWIEAYTKSVEDYTRQAKYGTADSGKPGEQGATADALQMNEVEQRLVQIESEVGETKFKKILLGTTMGAFKQSEIKSLFRSFTKPNRARWAKLIDLKLE